MEPIYGDRYMPRKFKIAVTVPGDNSMDIYTNDIGVVVITNDKGDLEGFNVMVGGGMGRTHNKEQSYPRVADHLGYVAKDDIFELMKVWLLTLFIKCPHMSVYTGSNSTIQCGVRLPPPHGRQSLPSSVTMGTVK